MKEEKLKIGSYTIPAYHFSVLIAGSGAAGLNAADTLYDEGVRDIAIITEGLKAGTSRNTGSDKQTYYKLSLGGNAPDSVRALAETLFEGGCTDGDIALCEAAASVPCFTKLLRLGIPFPKNSWGEYVGYKTDHDPSRRATSAGPYTSKFMTEALEAQVVSKGIRVFEHFQIVKLLTIENCAAGIVCLNLDTVKENEKPPSFNPEQMFTVFLSKRIIWATGGPAAIYDNTVYPECQNGATGAAFEAGAMGTNLTEWQYGLASVKPRWNVSGTFMQVLPRFISTNTEGTDEQEFLPEYFGGKGEMLSCVFLKGYQWPFDIRKVTQTRERQYSANISSPENGGSKNLRSHSSIIDILVYLETAKGRRVFLDFRKNPLNQENLDFSCLSDEAKSYLEAAGACFGTPFERLVKMNSPAVDFYKSRGIDLSSQPLEIALCAQHNNGGLTVDHWWRSNIKGLFPVGEAAGTHGVYRPGGSALNAGQVGSLRAALFIAHELCNVPNEQLKVSYEQISEQIQGVISLARSLCNNGTSGNGNAASLFAKAGKQMNFAGGPFRDCEKIEAALKDVQGLLEHFSQNAGIANMAQLPLAFRLRDTLICQQLYLSAMADFASISGRSRGSALYRNNSGLPPLPLSAQELAFVIDDGSLNRRIQEIRLEKGKPVIAWRDVRPIPATDESFELTWNVFREQPASFWA